MVPPLFPNPQIIPRYKKNENTQTRPKIYENREGEWRGGVGHGMGLAISLLCTHISP